MIAIAQAVTSATTRNNGALLLTGPEKGRVWPIAGTTVKPLGNYFLVKYDPQDQFCYIASTVSITGIYDNGGRTFDRYTVVYDEYATRIPGEEMLSCLGMSENPFHPQGYCEHSSCMDGAHLGKRIELTDLPADCQEALERDLQ